jgi:hypothetical protein
MLARTSPVRKAALLVCSLWALACDDAPAFERRGDVVQIPDQYKTCQEGDRCALSGDTCSDCCSAQAVRQEVEERVFLGVRKACVDQGRDTFGCTECQAEPRDAHCVAGRCVIEHAAMCSVGADPVAAGAVGIRDPFSCNKCVCQQDGTLACDEADCPKPCSAGMAPGTSCARCGFNELCDVLRTECLPVCESDLDCGGTPGGRCLDGVCKRVCGRAG